jgi:hypothetical protein
VNFEHFGGVGFHHRLHRHRVEKYSRADHELKPVSQKNKTRVGKYRGDHRL